MTGSDGTTTIAGPKNRERRGEDYSFLVDGVRATWGLFAAACELGYFSWAREDLTRKTGVVKRL